MSSESSPALVHELDGGQRSVCASAFASATGYQVPATGAPEKSRKYALAPAWPSVPLLTPHESVPSNLASIRTTWVLVSTAPQRSAAYWSAIRRCCPTVVPLLPPTGAAAVASLKPVPATIVIVVDADAVAGALAAIAAHASSVYACRRAATRVRPAAMRAYSAAAPAAGGSQWTVGVPAASTVASTSKLSALVSSMNPPAGPPFGTSRAVLGSTLRCCSSGGGATSGAMFAGGIVGRP